MAEARPMPTLESIWNNPAVVPWGDVLLVSLGAGVVGVFAILWIIGLFGKKGKPGA
jgi:hypothetical protein